MLTFITAAAAAVTAAAAVATAAAAAAAVLQQHAVSVLETKAGVTGPARQTAWPKIWLPREQSK